MGVRTFNGMELCAGIGALGLGVARALPGYRTVVAAEVEAFAVAVLAAQQQDGSLPEFPIWDDLTTFDGLPWRGVVDIVVAGFPCQDLSLAGKRAGINGARSGLFFDVVRIVRDVRPRYVFLENVAAITTGRALDAVLGALAEIGFDAEWGCLRASDVGAPHRRDRWWCLAWDREQLGHPERQSLALGGRIARDDGSECPTAQRAGDALADAARLQRPGQGRGLRDGGRVREVLQVVGDASEWTAERRGVARDVAGAASGAQGEGDQRERCGGAAGDPGTGIIGALGDAAVTGRGQVAAEDERQPRPTPHISGIRVGWPGFPPGPDDRDGWRAFLQRHPDLAPATERAVRGRADGASTRVDVCLCPRVDRLRGLGNAVVPAQAEMALRILWKRAFNEDL